MQTETVPFTESQLRSLIMALGKNGPFSEEDAVAVVEWASRVHMEYGLLQMVFAGELSLVVDEGEVKLSSKGVKPRLKGKEYARYEPRKL